MTKSIKKEKHIKRGFKAWRVRGIFPTKGKWTKWNKLKNKKK